jgi:hypothetical protein
MVSIGFHDLNESYPAYKKECDEMLRAIFRMNPFRGLLLVLAAALIVSGTGLAAPALLSIPGEMPPDDLRISYMGPDGSTSYQGDFPSVSYNSQRHEYLAVWQGSDDQGSLVTGELEIWGQRIDPDTGALLGSMVRISNMGPDGSGPYGAYSPDVAYNSIRDEFLVVWKGNDSISGGSEYEIWGQRLAYDGSGSLVEEDSDFQISEMGPDTDDDYSAEYPALAYNPDDDQFLVVWSGDDNSGTLVDDEREIFGQLLEYDLSDDLVEAGTDDFRITFAGPNGDPDYDALYPDVAYNTAEDEYLVVTQMDISAGGHLDNEWEVFGRRVTPAGGFAGMYKFSDMGGTGVYGYSALSPSLAYNPDQNEFLVVWDGNDNVDTYISFQVYAQRLGYTLGALNEVGSNDFRISDVGTVSNGDYSARNASVAYDSHNQVYMVSWSGSDNKPPLVQYEQEVFGQLLDGQSGAEVGLNDFRLSDMGPAGDTDYGVNTNAIASDNDGGFLAVWRSDDDRGSLVENELEIYGQLFSSFPPVYVPAAVSD